MLPNEECIHNEIKEEIKCYHETNENEHKTTQNVWDRAKAVLREKLITLHAYLKKKEKSQINNLTLHIKEPENNNK